MAEQPVGRLEDEPDEAFAAFVAFAELGPGRTVTGAYRQREGKPGAKQASGRWNKWVKDFRWAERARAYDNHLAAQRQKGIDRAVEAEGEDWGRWLAAVMKDAAQGGADIIRNSGQVARFKPFAVTVDKGSQTTIYQPNDPRAYATAAAAMLQGMQVVAGAMAHLMPPAAADQGGDEDEGEDDGVEAEAAERDAEWDRQQQLLIDAIGSEPPAPAAAPSSTPDPGAIAPTSSTPSA